MKFKYVGEGSEEPFEFMGLLFEPGHFTEVTDEFVIGKLSANRAFAQEGGQSVIAPEPSTKPRRSRKADDANTV